MFSHNQSSDGIDGAVLTYTGVGVGSITITRSIFSHNTNIAGFGGDLGISLYGAAVDVDISNSLFEGGQALYSGGSISIEGSAVTASITNSLFNQNQAHENGGAIYTQDGVDFTLTNNTFFGNVAETGNGGAIFVGASSYSGSFLASFNTFRSGSVPATSIAADLYHTDSNATTSHFENNIFTGTADDCAGDFTNFTFTNNLSGDADCGATQLATGVDSTIRMNGGPLKTMALLSESNAIDAAVAGTLGCPTQDARGETRPQGEACDIGSFEIYIDQSSGSGGGGGGGGSSAASTNSNTDSNPPPPPEDNQEVIDSNPPPPPPPPPGEPIPPVDEPVDAIPSDETTDSETPVDTFPTVTPVTTIPSVEVTQPIRSVEITKVVTDIIKEIPKKTADAVSVVGVALPTVLFAVTQPAVATNVISIPIRLWNLIPIWLGFRRKKRPWGTVYDSVTKQPLDPVYVSLENSAGKEVATTITDLDGRFGFLVPPGQYKINVHKDSYSFPSTKLADKSEDVLYGNIYSGGPIEISGEEDLVIKNIPMDSKMFNWNEFEKAKNKQLMKFYSKRDIFLASIAEVVFWVGLAISFALLVIGPSTLNYILLGIYAAVLVLRLFGIKPKKPGYIVEASNGFPLSFGLVRVFSKALNKEIVHTIIGKTGKYYCLVPNGEYYIKIDKKIGEDDYQEVFTSPAFRVKKGFIGKTFKI